MIFAAFSTVIAVFENIMSFWLELTKLGRRVIAIINVVLLLVLSLPAVFSLSIWSDITVMGFGFLDLEDKLVSNLILPVGSLIYVLFCTRKLGWGWNNFITEANTGEGPKFPKWMKLYMTWILPLIIIIVLVMSVVPMFI